VSEQKSCQQCKAKFVIDDQTIEFLDKISPTFNGKKFDIPTNEFCEECRHIRRMAWRNETHLYKRKCALCSKEILSMYRPDSEHIVYCLQCWWSDKWSAKKYALEYNPNRTFIDQFNELNLKVPHPGLTVTNSQNCDYCSNTVDSKNCYMCFSTRGEDCMYGRKMVDCRDTVDSLFASNCENCYEMVFSDNCYGCKYIHESRGCRDSSFLYDCADCHDCFMCSNLRGKGFVFRNKQLTEEEYMKLLKSVWDGSREKTDNLYEEFVELIGKSIHRENRNHKCENCTGDHLTNCKNCKECFELLQGEDSLRVYDSMGDPSADNIDCDHNPGGQLDYECSSSYPIFGCAFCLLVYNGRNSYYSINCFNNCDSLFGCIGLKHAKYSILNKEYTPKEYEKIVAQVIESMRQDGDWGKFFPPKICPYNYNESVAHDYWPKSKKIAESFGFSWQEKDFSANFNGEFYRPNDKISDYEDENLRKILLDSVLQCKRSKKPFKISPQELAFYLKNNIPIPTITYFERHKERMKFRNPRKLFDRKCDNCTKAIRTSYSPDRPEKIYCEKCYQQEII